jgi:hypothetical protein
MKSLLSLLLTFALATSALAQVVPPDKQPVKPPVKPPVAKPIVPPTIKAQGGEQVVIDAKGAKGDVVFSYDKKTFDGKHAVQVGKALVLTVPTLKENKTYTVICTSFDDRTQDETVISVAGSDDPGPIDPPDGSPISKLSAKVDALTKVVTALNTTVAAQDKRLTALEQIKPNPPPGPTDPFTATLQAAYIADGRPADKLAKLISIYKLSDPTVNNPLNTTYAMVLAVMHSGAQAYLGEPDPANVTILPNVRRAIAAELKVDIGKGNLAVLDAPGRANISAQFQMVRKALEGVK